MHNLYVPPYKIFLFLISFALTYFAAKLLNDKTFPVPDFKFPETKIEVSEETDNQIPKPEISWTEIKSKLMVLIEVWQFSRIPCYHSC